MMPHPNPAAVRGPHGASRTKITGVIAMVALLAAMPVTAQERSPTVEKASSSRARGAEGAPILVYEIANFACSHCARFAIDVFPSIDSAFVKTGKVQWVFVNLPVPTNPMSWLAHEAAMCAGAVAGKFWEMHDRIFEVQEEWQRVGDASAALERYARDLGVPAAPFSECTRTDAVAPLLLQDIMFAMSGRVNGTPAFIIDNEQSVMGLKSFEEWKAILDPLFKSKSGK